MRLRRRCIRNGNGHGEWSLMRRLTSRRHDIYNWFGIGNHQSRVLIRSRHRMAMKLSYMQETRLLSPPSILSALTRSTKWSSLSCRTISEQSQALKVFSAYTDAYSDAHSRVPRSLAHNAPMHAHTCKHTHRGNWWSRVDHSSPASPKDTGVPQSLQKPHFS